MGHVAERQRPLRRSEYERMIDAGLFRDEHVELIRGVIIEMSPQNSAHAAVIQMLTQILVPPLVGRAAVRVQLPFAASDDSLPEPDVALVDPKYFGGAHQDRAFLIIEVADTSLRFDRQDKAELNATAGVAEYWVVNLAGQLIERHTDPVAGAYTRATPFARGETIAPLAFPDVGVRVNDVFGGERFLPGGRRPVIAAAPANGGHGRSPP